MSETLTQQKNLELISSSGVVAAQLKQMLTKAEVGIQKLHDEKSALVFNTDNISAIQDFLKKVRKAKTTVKDGHAAIKKPYKDSGDLVDEGKRLVDTELTSIETEVQHKLDKLAKEQARLQAEQEAERLLKERLRSQIQKDVLSASDRIVSAKTRKELIKIESGINLLKGSEGRYGILLEEAKTALSNLTSQISNQKDLLLKLEKLENPGTEVTDEELLLEIEAEKEKLTSQISESSEIIANTAINTATAATKSEPATVYYPSVKTRRKSWTWDENNIDFGKLIKAHPDWVRYELNEEKVKEFMKANKETWDEKEGHNEAGLKFYLDIKY